MLLPIRTNILPRRTPYINYALIAANAIIFLLEYQTNPRTGHLEFRPWVLQFMLTTERPQLWQFISYAFLHGGLIYLAGAVFSGIGHMLIGGGNVLGASGAVAAVTGAYLVLFPQTLITVLYWFFFIGTMELPALYFIAFKLIIWDNIVEPRFAPPVAIAYGAHIAGYAFGIASMVGLLATHIISGSNYDMWAMIKRWNRRRLYRDVVSSGYDPFTGRTKTRRIKVKEVIKSAAEQQKEEQIRQLRSEISNRMLQRNLPAAAELYIELIEQDSKQILPRQQLLDIANHLAGDNRHTEAAQAYEQFLIHYGTYQYAEQVELMLGIIYSRYLKQPEPAAKHLEAAAKKLSDPDQLKMCREEIARL